MRIISGKYKHRRFQVPPTFSARPTTDFAKENLFNVLNNLVDWEDMEALDLFAGTGSISFELLSRGCRQVTAVEMNAKHASFILKVAKELQVTDDLVLVRMDVLRLLQSKTPRSYDLIFADPPYQMEELGDIPRKIIEGDWLEKDGILIMEHPNTFDFSDLPYFYQHRIYGSVNFSIFIKSSDETTEEEQTDA